MPLVRFYYSSSFNTHRSFFGNKSVHQRFGANLKNLPFAKICCKFLAFLGFLHKKCWKWLFWPAFGVRSIQTLVEIYNRGMFFWDGKLSWSHSDLTAFKGTSAQWLDLTTTTKCNLSKNDKVKKFKVELKIPTKQIIFNLENVFQDDF